MLVWSDILINLEIPIGVITDLDLIDWIWHLLLKIEAAVIGSTLLHFSITKSHFPRFYSFYTLIMNIKGIKMRKMWSITWFIN